MQSGVLRKWDNDRGYGFLRVDDSAESMFVHHSHIRSGVRIEEGQRFSFETEINERNGKPMAVRVTIERSV